MSWDNYHTSITMIKFYRTQENPTANSYIANKQPNYLSHTSSINHIKAQARPEYEALIDHKAEVEEPFNDLRTSRSTSQAWPTARRHH